MCLLLEHNMYLLAGACHVFCWLRHAMFLLAGAKHVFLNRLGHILCMCLLAGAIMYLLAGHNLYFSGVAYKKVSVVSDYLPKVTSDYQILYTQESFCTWVWDHSRVHLYLVVGLCKLGTIFCVNFEQQRCKISMYTAASALQLLGKCLPLWF